MIARVWRGWVRVTAADTYETHFRHAVLAHLRQLSGFRGADLLRRTSGAEVEFTAITRFDSLEAIRAFAGEDFEAAVVAPEAQRVLTRYDTRCTHHEIAVTTQALPLDGHDSRTK